MYGRDCITQCSGNCLNNLPCNSTNGHCDSGCGFGYLDVFCNKSNTLLIILITFYYKMNTKYIMEVRRESNSVKVFACNFDSSLKRQIISKTEKIKCAVICFIACDHGTYGLACKQNCSADCKDGLCNNVDGSCICTNGKNGSPLCIASKLLI